MKQVILGYFPSEAEADTAAAAIKAWDDEDEEVRFTSIGVLALGSDGKLKVEKMGKRTVGKGMGIGIALAALTPAGLGVVAAGAALGALHKKDLGIKQEHRDRVAAELAGGRAAVGVLADSAFEAGVVTEKLRAMGATTDSVLLSDDIGTDDARVDVASGRVQEHQEQARG
jgi:hypothetical protein